MDLTDLRAEIDAIDEEILRTLARRFAVCARVAAYKSEKGTPMMQPDRIREVKRRRIQVGAEHGLRPQFVDRLYDLIIDEACVLEERLMHARA